MTCEPILERATRARAPKKWEFSVSVTTRTPRDGEIDGKDYTFISNSDFEHYGHFCLPTELPGTSFKRKLE